jgi:acetyl esterase
MQYFWSLYLNDQAIDSLDYRACPMRTPDSILKHFPKTFIILAKNDILLDEGLKFAERLESVNVSVETTVYNDVYHGFFSMGAGGKVRDAEICKNLQALTL